MVNVSTRAWFIKEDNLRDVEQSVAVGWARGQAGTQGWGRQEREVGVGAGGAVEGASLNITH